MGLLLILQMLLVLYFYHLQRISLSEKLKALKSELEAIEIWEKHKKSIANSLSFFGIEIIFPTTTINLTEEEKSVLRNYTSGKKIPIIPDSKLFCGNLGKMNITSRKLFHEMYQTVQQIGEIAQCLMTINDYGLLEIQTIPVNKSENSKNYIDNYRN